jgi:hypothetical protein
MVRLPRARPKAAHAKVAHAKTARAKRPRATRQATYDPFNFNFNQTPR